MRDLQGGGDASGEGGDNDPSETKDSAAGGEGQGGVAAKRRGIAKRRHGRK